MSLCIIEVNGNWIRILFWLRPKIVQLMLNKQIVKLKLIAIINIIRLQCYNKKLEKSVEII